VLLSCHDADPGRLGPDFAITTGTQAALDQFDGSFFNESGSRLEKGFDPTNPQPGSTIIATFAWRGSSNIVTRVTDHLSGGQPVGNTYTLVEYVTAGGVSMATYVAVNVQNYPYPNTEAGQVLVVEADLSQPTGVGGVIISSFMGVQTDPAQALGPHLSATGTGSSTTVAQPAAITPGQGALVYAVSLASIAVGLDRPAAWTNVTTVSDDSIKADAEYSVRADSTSTAPQWTWYFTQPSAWVASLITLNPAPGQTLRLDGTLSENGTILSQGFYPTNPHLGDAIVASFFWVGSTNIIDSVSDFLEDGSPVGNQYHLVEYVTRGGISMATYVATNARNFPDPNPPYEQVLSIRANLSSSVTDGGVLLSAYTGVQPSFLQALGAHGSAADTGSSAPTVVDPGPLTANAGALVYAVALSNGVVGIDTPPGLTDIQEQSDSAMKSDGEFVVTKTAGTVEPRWQWYFNAHSAWLASALVLNAQ
jgi:hypothetical protein